MKKLNRKGFTLIELLAVIVIMGILMMVAIPAVQRYIKNAEKDTFINITKTYVDATRTAYAGNLFTCNSSCSVTFRDLRSANLVEDTRNIAGRVTITVDSNGKATYKVEATDLTKKYAIGSAVDPNTVTRSIIVSTSAVSDTYSGTVSIPAQ